MDDVSVVLLFVVVMYANMYRDYDKPCKYLKGLPMMVLLLMTTIKEIYEWYQEWGFTGVAVCIFALVTGTIQLIMRFGLAQIPVFRPYTEIIKRQTFSPVLR